MSDPLTEPAHVLIKRLGCFCAVYYNGAKEAASAHETRAQAEAWVKYVARTNGYPEPVIEVEP